MMRARLKTAVQDVWQHGENYMPGWVHSCTEPRDGELYLVRGADKQRIEIGDYLIRDLDGAPTWSTDEDFRRDYEIVT